jgi:hypothetical protein
MPVLAIVLIVIAALIAAFLALAAIQPADFSLVRSAAMSAPASKPFAVVNDFHRWEEWSPWAKIDPDAKNTFTGSQSGQGAVFDWEGKKSGAGRMTLLESVPNQRIKVDLEFSKPMKARNSVLFTFKPDGDQTVVTWEMSGTKNFMSKCFCMMMSMERMVGPQFEDGLRNMKALVERGTV